MKLMFYLSLASYISVSVYRKSFPAVYTGFHLVGDVMTHCDRYAMTAFFPTGPGGACTMDFQGEIQVLYKPVTNQLPLLNLLPIK